MKRFNVTDKGGDAMTTLRNQLPDCTLGRSGSDLFSSPTILTVIMIPFERFSPFSKAVDELYQAIDVPFNLIVIEGNSPESVRASLEKQRRRHKNLSIIYSNHHTSVGAAINLGVPHVKTPYAFIIDNDVRIPRGTMSRLLKKALEKPCGIMAFQNYAILPRKEVPDQPAVQSLGIRTCFLISREAVQRLGRLDETMTPFTMGIDIRMAAEDLGITICNETDTCLELERENSLWPMDGPIHSFQWNEKRIFYSLDVLEKKWGIRLHSEDFAVWLGRKRTDLEKSRNLRAFLDRFILQLRGIGKEKELKEFPDFLLPTAA